MWVGTGGDAPLTRMQVPRAGLERVERWTGDTVSAQIRRHHRRRLRRIGWEHALDPPAGGWAGRAAVRQGNSLELLVDGAEALPRIADELEARARTSTSPAGTSRPTSPSRGTASRSILRNLLAESRGADRRPGAGVGRARRCRSSGPRAARCGQMRERLTRDTRIQCALDAHERPMHCHHEKTIVIDDRLAFVGGIDSDLRSRRPLRHERARRARQRRLARRLRADRRARGRGRRRPLPPALARGLRRIASARRSRATPAGDVELQIVRTVPEKIYRRLPRGDFSILESYVRALAAAERLIYIENQFLWSPEIAAVLATSCVTRRTPTSGWCSSLPAKPNNGGDDTRGVARGAHRGRRRAAGCSPARSTRGWARSPIRSTSTPRLAIVDDRWLTIGSANLNEHSLFNDTEMNLVTHDPASPGTRGCGSGRSISSCRSPTSPATPRR